MVSDWRGIEFGEKAEEALIRKLMKNLSVMPQLQETLFVKIFLNIMAVQVMKLFLHFLLNLVNKTFIAILAFKFVKKEGALIGWNGFQLNGLKKVKPFCFLRY